MITTTTAIDRLLYSCAMSGLAENTGISTAPAIGEQRVSCFEQTGHRARDYIASALSALHRGPRFPI
jgi:hypothetical protein